MDGFRTLQDAVIHFSNFENCRTAVITLRWPDGKVKCPYCGSEKVTWLAKARVWKCYIKHPRPRFSLKTGTVFEDSPLGLEKWLPALWLVVNCKNGVSSCESARELGVTQKTAWFMNHRLRFALRLTMTRFPLTRYEPTTFFRSRPFRMSSSMDSWAQRRKVVREPV
jgi:transposase-like protein